MKKKTFLKQGAYQKVDNTKGNRIKGALDLNKEVLDTLVDKSLASTLDCCKYFPQVPSLVASGDVEEIMVSYPVGTLIMVVDENGDYILLALIIQADGGKTFVPIDTA